MLVVWALLLSQLREDVVIWVAASSLSPVNTACDSLNAMRSSVGQGWLRVYLDINCIMFYLFTPRRSRTESAWSHGCLVSKFECQRESLFDIAVLVCSGACYTHKIKPGAPWWTAPRWECQALFDQFPGLCTLFVIDPQRLSRLIVSSGGSKMHTVCLLVRLFMSVSCWARLNRQHLITSLDLCLKGHQRLVYYTKLEQM